MVKILIMTIQVNFVPRPSGTKNSPELSLLKFLPLTYHHSHFLAATLDFTSFLTIAFQGAALFFYSLAVFGLDIYIYIICTFVTGPAKIGHVGTNYIPSLYRSYLSTETE